MVLFLFSPELKQIFKEKYKFYYIHCLYDVFINCIINDFSFTRLDIIQLFKPRKNSFSNTFLLVSSFIWLTVRPPPHPRNKSSKIFRKIGRWLYQYNEDDYRFQFDSKKFVVRFRFYWRPPEGFYFHWRGFKKCFLQFKTLRRVIYIPLEGFRYPSWGVKIPLEGFSYSS